MLLLTDPYGHKFVANQVGQYYYVATTPSEVAALNRIDAATALAATAGGSLEILKHTHAIYYVNGTTGNNANVGTSPALPFATIAYAISQASAGDIIRVGYDTYDEAGLDLNKAALQLWLGPGVILQDSADGDVLTISAFGCVVYGLGNVRIDPTGGATGISVTGGFASINNLRVNGNDVGGIGYDIQGAGAEVYDCRCASPTIAAFKVQASKCLLDKCCTGGTLDAGTIGFWVTGSCDKVRLRSCSSQGHSTAGFQFDAGCTNIVAYQCEGGGGDGHFIDNAANTHLNILDRDAREIHEHTYPTPDGEGTAGDPVTISSEVNDETGADSTANYYGDPYVIVPPATITVDWFYHGMNIYATSVNDEQRFFSYRAVYDISAVRNGGNNWDENETSLTFDDASKFEVNDLIWIRTPGYRPNGEIVQITNIAGNVVTVARQTENSGRLGLHWNHTTNDGGNEVAYLCWRDENRYHSSDFDYSASGARDFTAVHWRGSRRMHVNDGLIIRMVNGTDDANSQADVSVIWSD